MQTQRTNTLSLLTSQASLHHKKTLLQFRKRMTDFQYRVIEQLKLWDNS